MEAIYDIGGGWKVRRDEDVMPPEIILYRHGRRVYSLAAAPKMKDEDALTLAQQIAQVYDTAWAAGWEECRRVIIAAAEESKSLGYASLVIQSGEVESESHTLFIEDVLRRIAHLDLGVTLSLGEQTEDVYARWRKAGATRYLLRIETSNPTLYSKIHPASCSWRRRVECLHALRRTGYQVGTGVMCGLPGQTVEDLAADIRFYGDMDVDMIGMGPYIPHPDTPLAQVAPSVPDGQRLMLGLKMIAVMRLYLHDVNIAAATALQALAHDGRERGIMAGANVLMPNVTDRKYRRSYRLYANKPCLDETAALCRGCLDRRLAAIGESLLYGKRGDSPHFHRRTEHE